MNIYEDQEEEDKKLRRTMKMNEVDIEQIKKSIKNAPINLPDKAMTADDLWWWLNGYSACLEKVAIILDDTIDQRK